MPDVNVKLIEGGITQDHKHTTTAEVADLRDGQSMETFTSPTEGREMNVLIEMTALFASHPSNTAPVEEVATWYREKGRFHERLAEHCRPEERADEVRYAAAAKEHARLLLSRARVVSVADQPAGGPIALAHRNRVPRAA